MKSSNLALPALIVLMFVANVTQSQEKKPGTQNGRSVIGETRKDPDQFDCKSDLVYSKPNGNPLMLDLYIPKAGKGPFPTVLMFNGTGPFTKGRAGLRRHAIALS